MKRRRSLGIGGFFLVRARARQGVTFPWGT